MQQCQYQVWLVIWTIPNLNSGWFQNYLGFYQHIGECISGAWQYVIYKTSVIGFFNCFIVLKEPIRERKRETVNHQFYPVRCIVCDESCIEASNCTSFKVMPRSKRWQFVHKLKLCRRCLKRHSTNRCNLVKPWSFNGFTRSYHLLLHNSGFDHTVAKKTSSNVNMGSK